MSLEKLSHEAFEALDDTEAEMVRGGSVAPADGSFTMIGRCDVAGKIQNDYQLAD
ncbi:MAG TPA: hypothetical protein VFR37_12505 [Longimicrobium sp.]|nr:hypothetical protein [Longimicrobium sp.]